VPTTVLLISGSTRDHSTNTAALRTARVLAPGDVNAVWFDGLAELPAFTPDAPPDEPHPAVADLHRSLAVCDAVLVSTPEYAGTLPGSLKNLLDWTVGSADLDGKPVAWVNVAAPGRGEGADATLRLVLGYVGAEIVEDACVRVFVPRESVGPDGLITDPAARAGLADVMSRLVVSLESGAGR
jgi:chromate reductase, NAD(P)H dehydrogenase (quinone)